MLPSAYQSKYLAFQRLVQELQTASQVGITDFSIHSIQSAFRTTQQFFQTELLPLDCTILSPTQRSKIQGCHTEINKQLRLLGVDIPFLRITRNPERTQQQQQQIHSRLEMLMRYCEMLLAEDNDTPSLHA